MTDRDARLEQFFGSYFNQDWDEDGSQSWRQVVATYLNENSRTQVVLLLKDLRSWSAEAKAEGLETIPANFYCYYDPRADGLSERTWVEQIIDEFEKQLTN
jgi:hypothetical protein